MHLCADKIYLDPREDDYPNSVGFYDRGADYWVAFSRFSDLTPDRGMIEVLVRDQIWTESANVVVELSRNHCHVRLDAEAASRLLGLPEYMIDFHASDEQFQLMCELFRIIFQDLPGLTIIE